MYVDGVFCVCIMSYVCRWCVLCVDNELCQYMICFICG